VPLLCLFQATVETRTWKRLWDQWGPSSVSSKGAGAALPCSGNALTIGTAQTKIPTEGLKSNYDSSSGLVDLHPMNYEIIQQRRDE
jgi:hypothetical protein